jgi:hypothetical protein
MTREQLDRLRKTPAYPFIEAAHYLNMPVSTLRAWCIGQDYKVKGSTRRFQPLIVLDGAKSEGLSFLNLVEAHVLAAIRRTLPADVDVTRTFRQANFIDTAIANVSSSLLEGVVIVSVVIVLFLMNWRAAVISLSAPMPTIRNRVAPIRGRVKYRQPTHRPGCTRSQSSHPSRIPPTPCR